MAKPIRRKIKKIVKAVSKAIKKTAGKPVKKRVASKKPAARPKKPARKAPAKKAAARRRAVALKPELAAVLNPPLAASSADDRIPHYYGEDRLALLARDPWWLYAYWEVTPGRRAETEARARRAGHREWKTVLRVYDVSKHGPSRPDTFFDIELHFYTDNWYIDVGLPGRQWMAEVGLRAPGGAFFALVRSNVVGTPAFGLSDVLDEEWMLPEDVYLKIIGLAGPGGQSGSMDIRKLLEKYLKRVISSESSPKAPLAR